jgi:hypothetical protein
MVGFAPSETVSPPKTSRMMREPEQVYSKYQFTRACYFVEGAIFVEKSYYIGSTASLLV